MAMFEQMRANVGKLLKGIDRYNPENLATLERYVETQAKENAYDLEANLAVLKLGRKSAGEKREEVKTKPCLGRTRKPGCPLVAVWGMGHGRAAGRFTRGGCCHPGRRAWLVSLALPPVLPVSPADNQLKVWMSKYGWSADDSGQIFICSQEESIKPKNIVEKIDFDSVSSIMASSQ
ncbi:PREDICTED: eukaryotic translation initiation factor 3 subunit K [Dipodomys ordii]|uniref:Eukaryotic translation initiation factor 3 subunit K n=1 Tax=Dipodomys ordii TaxID=10020 RepID=A0A1S3FYL6_DIPOR|nr:PREDICTED: eukaryotic translation initiation factor 3 subunit K [Dipodomys ordii]